jgi:hypothetical protein
VSLADSPRVAFDTSGKVNVVWGQTAAWISQSVDSTSFINTVNLAVTSPIPNTGGPRVGVDAFGNIYVAWTDTVNESQQGSYCMTSDPNATSGGNFWMNETLANNLPDPGNTRNLSNTDWASPNRSAGDIQRFPNGFFGCSFDNLSLFVDGTGRMHLLWSDQAPDEDILTSKTEFTYQAPSPFAGDVQFSFPINLASVGAASPQVAVDTAGTLHVVWSGGPGGGSGIYYIRSDDGGSNFTHCPSGQPLCGAINVAPQGSPSPAFPQIAVDSNSNVNIAWEQPTAALNGDGTDMFNVFFARSTDKGVTFPTVSQVSKTPSQLCFTATAKMTADMTPDNTTCGTVQIGVGANSTPSIAWVNQASGSGVADIDFATSTFPTGSITPSTANLTATNTSANFTVTVNGFSSPITFSCLDADKNAPLPSWLACNFSPQPLDPAQSNTDTLTIKRQGTPTSSLLLSPPTSRSLPEFGPLMVWSMAFATIGLMAVLMLATGHRRDLSRALVLRGCFVMTLTVVLAVGLISCGGSTSSPATSTASGSGGTTGTTGGGGGTGGGSSVTVHVAVQAQSGGTTTTLGTVTITAQ